MEDKFVIIDGNSIFYREFFALPSLKNRFGEPTNAIYGFAIQIVDIITKIKPTHLAVAFDAGKITFRNSLYEGYKATRKPMPDDLRSQIAPLKDMLSLMGIKCIEKSGIEGDDILGSLSTQYGENVIIVTGDRDSYQLVKPNVVVYLNRKGMSDVKIMDEKAIFDEFGVKPCQMVFIKALQGDSSDNIPGVKGIGEKTAQELIRTYGNLDNLYKNIDKISGKTKEKLIEGKSDAYMSLELAKILTDEKFDYSYDEFRYIFPFNKDVWDFCERNDFKRLLARKDCFCEQIVENIDYKPIKEVEIVEIKDVDVLFSLLKPLQEVSFVFQKDKIHFSGGEIEYVVNIKNDLVGNGLYIEEVMQTIKQFFEDEKISKILFDSKQDRHNLINHSIEICGNIFDCMIAKHLVCGDVVNSIDDVIDIGFLKTPAYALLLAKNELAKQLNEMKMTSLYNEVELPLSIVLFNMEMYGFKIDQNRLEELEKKYDEEIVSLTQNIYESVGKEFNVNSPKQLANIVYDELKLMRSKKRSTASDVLVKLIDKHPLIPLVIRYRKVAKFLNSFIKNMYSYIDENGYVHTSFNQTLTSTGRLSSSDPNMQNVPVRSEESREIRSMFVASSLNNLLVDVDYSQIELRVMAHVTEDKKLVDAFNNGIDIHTQTAQAIFDVDANSVTPEMRRKAKVVNFGVNYGISEFGLADDLKIPVWEARKYIDNFFELHPNIKEYSQNAINQAKATGRVSTILGRTRKMNDISSSDYQLRMRAERSAINMPIQGSAADIIKLAMINIFKEIKERKLKSRLIMQVHDELIFDTPREEVETIKELAKRNMVNAVKLKVPLDVDMGVAYRWSDGH